MTCYVTHSSNPFPQSRNITEHIRWKTTGTKTHNGYSTKFLDEVQCKKRFKEQHKPSPEEMVKKFFEKVDPKPNINYAVLPYIKGLTEPLKRILNSYDIRVTSRPVSAPQQLFPSVKDRPPLDDQTSVICEINYTDCSWGYIGETGRAFNTRRKEHRRNVANYKAGSTFAKHAWDNDHHICFGYAKILEKWLYRHRAVLESWYTVVTEATD